MRPHNDAAISLISAYKKGKVVNFQVSVRIKLDILGRSDITASYRGEETEGCTGFAQALRLVAFILYSNPRVAIDSDSEATAEYYCVD